MCDHPRIYPLYNIEFEPIDWQSPASLKWHVVKRSVDGRVLPFTVDDDVVEIKKWAEESVNAAVAGMVCRMKEPIDVPPFASYLYGASAPV